MATATINIPYLSTYCSLPQATLITLKDAPTVELVNTLLLQISAKAREFDEVKAEKLRLEVELENAVRSGESKARALKSSFDKGLKEVADLREKLKSEEDARTALESELQGLKSTSSTSISEVSDLRTRINSLESSNRDTLSLLEAKSTAHDQLAEELSAQHQRTLELRREVSGLEQSIQQASSASASAKYREQSLQQEVDLLKRNNDWYETELKTKSGEYLKYRKEKGSRTIELQRLNEDANSTIEALKRTEQTLRNRLEEVSEKADDAFAKIQQMQEEAGKTEEAFRVELDSANRLAVLQKASADTTKQRMLDVQSSLEQTKSEAADEIGRIRAELETEHSDKEAAERRVLELEVQVERLEADHTALRDHASMPGTPHRGINGNGVATPVRIGSPGAPSSTSASRMKGSLSFTQMYSEYNTVKAELDTEKRRNEKLSATIDEMIQDLEIRQPEIEELRSDHERLQSEIVEMSTLVEDVGKERDRLRKDSRKWEGQVEGRTKEGEVLRQQLRDLSAQVKVLLMEVHAREQGLEGLSAADQMELDRVARGELDDETLDGFTDTDRFISHHLATFKNVQELQEQNTKLLRLTRELGERMEGEEARAHQTQQARDREELESLREKVERYKDEMKSMVTQSQSFIRERDMFRRMLSHRGQLPPGSDLASVFAQSLDAPPATPPPCGVLNSIEQSPSSKDLADYAKLLKEMQAHFDSYRSEAAADRSVLKQQLDSLSRKNGDLQGETARTNSQLTLANERYEMLQANYAMLKGENQELQRRSQGLAESAAKQDLRTQQVAEDLVEAKGLLDSMRNETANLKAEKQFWKSVEKRLTEENESLTNERNRLNTLNANLQNLINEREHSDSEVRRRLQAQVEFLESELQNTKRKLDEELQDGKKSALRREYYHQQNQNRIDDLVASLGSVREELIATKTTRDHLQARANELAIELQSAEERVQVLQPKPTQRPTVITTDSAENGDTDHGEPGVSREQELAVEVSELKRDLQLAKGDLQNARDQAEQYKAISQSSEEELQSLNETQDQYRAEMDRMMTEKDTKIGDLEQRIEEITSELSSTNTELSTLRDKRSDGTRRLEEQKVASEAEIARLKDEDERHATAAQFHQEDLKVQAEIAQQAQQNYENELLKHAEAAKALQKARSEYNQLKLDIVELRTEADTAKSNLARSEESWTEVRERFIRELADMRTRREDVDRQNRLLHQQLESVSGQISALQQKRAEHLETDENFMSPASSLENLQEVIRYLRREKEIVDVQHELSVQEAKRLKQQLDYAQSQLDETRLKLDQQRRAQGESERSALNHNKLMDTINELNLFRESSVTLRNEARQAQASLAEKTKRVEELLEQIQPLQTKMRELENQREIQEGEMHLLQDDRDRWQKRTQDILQKYDRVDPAEMESLKEQITTLEAERDELIAAKQPLQEQVDGIPERIKQAEDEVSQRWQESRQRLTDQFKGRSKDLTAKVNERQAALQAVEKEKEELKQQLDSLTGELDAAKAERDKAIARAPEATAEQSQAHKSATPNGIEEGQVDESRESGHSDEEVRALEEKLNAAEIQADLELKRAERLQDEVRLCQGRISELEQQVSELQRSRDEATTQLSQPRTEQQPTETQEAELQQNLEELRQELSQAQHEIDRLQTDATIQTSITKASSEDGSKSVAEQVTEQVEAIRTELEARHQSRLQQLEAQFKQRAIGMSKQLSKKLVEHKEQYRQKTEAEHELIEKLKSEYEQQIESLKVQHQEELDVLKQNEETRFEQFRNTSGAQHPTSNDAAEGHMKSETQISGDEWTPTEAQIKDLVANNPTVKNIVKKNILTKINQERENLTAKIKEEQEKLATERLDEVQRKAKAAQENAVNMEGKKYGVKLNIADNRAKAAQAKIDFVESAANATPQRPVGEVWAIAKDTKPVPVATQQQQGVNQAIVTTQASTFGQPTPASPHAQQSVSGGTLEQPSATQAQVRSPLAPRGVQQPLGTSSTSSPTQARAVRPPLSNTAPSTTSQAETDPSQGPDPSVLHQEEQSQQASTQLQANPDLPAKPPQTQQLNHPNAGTGPTAIRGLMSAIPRGGAQVGRGARGGRGGQPQTQPNQVSQGLQVQNQDQTQTKSDSKRGTSLPRGAGGLGRGRGTQGRGGSQQVQASALPQAQTQAQRSPGGGRGALNAGARQFVPQGNKRVREDGQDGGVNANGKRIKNEDAAT
ncbi:MAG: hypothetical protein M1830_003073 [Pleopsidium flavum]|nr:MAG: hypothetical protein M1830_003073 [Pleopsidium flavum]